MIELIVGTYGVLCWLLFKKFKLVPVNTYTIWTAILGGFVILLSLLMLLAMFHPATKDARFYVYTTPIVSEVRGKVIEVPARLNNEIAAGDVIFQIDPRPFQYEVDRLEAQLANAKRDVEQFKEGLTAAEAATAQQRSAVAAIESEIGKQAIDAYEVAKAETARVATTLELAKKEEERYRQLLTDGAVSASEYDRVKQRFDALTSELQGATAAERQAEEKLSSGQSRLQSEQELLKSREAQEREARLEYEAESGGVNPIVLEIEAQLNAKRLDLENATVRAPADGYVAQLFVKPGQMAVPMPLSPVGIFVHAGRPELVASFPQNVMANIKPGLEVELAFKTHPGMIFKAKVSKIAVAIPEGQLLASGQLRSLTPASSPARVPVVFEYGDDLAALKLPPGSQAVATIYTEKMHALSIVRKILLRIKSWEHYLFVP